MPATKPTAKVVSPPAPKGAKPEPTGTVVVKGHKVPKSLAACADDLFTTRNQRLALDKQVESLKSREAALKEHLINKLPKSQASGISGLLARVTIGSKTKPVAADWDKIHKYIARPWLSHRGVQGRLGGGPGALLEQRSHLAWPGGDGRSGQHEARQGRSGPAV
jgi:hypothetical protein